ncbi:NAD(P)-binding protein [Streptosporangium canum]|uniref:NAD(P)-binding protein n=1 Tax=Streptosporangium canum TaxID=324952 RepID=UPI00341C06F2
MILVIGAGQAGLAAGHELRLAGHDVLLLEAHPRLGESWRRRWDSLRHLIALAVQPQVPGPCSQHDVVGLQSGALFDPGPGVQQGGHDRAVPDAATGRGPFHPAPLGPGQGVGLTGFGDAGALDVDAQPELGVQQGYSGQGLVDRGGGGPGACQVPPPGGEGGLGTDDVGEGVVVVVGVGDQPGGVGARLPLVSLGGVGRQLAPVEVAVHGGHGVAGGCGGAAERVRVGELVALTVGSVAADAGHTVILFRRKGGKVGRPPAGAATGARPAAAASR